MAENTAPPPMATVDTSKLAPESVASLRGTFRTAGRTDAEIDAAFGVKTDPNAPRTPETEAEKLRISLHMTPEQFRENQQRQGINPNTGMAKDVLDRPELSAPVNASDYKLPFGMIPKDVPIKDALAQQAAIQAAFKAGDIPTFTAGVVYEALQQSAATIAQITNPLARSLHNQHERVILGNIYPQGADAAMKSAAIVIAKMPAEQVKAWRDNGSLDSARVVALLARVGEIHSACEAKKAKG